MASSAADQSFSTHSPPPSTTRGPLSPCSQPEAVYAAPEALDCSPSKSIEGSSLSAGVAPPLSDSPDHGGDANAALSGKKPAWNVPFNGSIEVGSVMGASWPALSESTRASPKSPSSDSLKAFPDGSLPASLGPVITSPSPKQTMTNPNPNSTPNNVSPAHQKSMKQLAAGVSGASGSLSNCVTAPHPASAETHQPMMKKQWLAEPSSKGSSSNNQEHGGRGSGFSPQTHGANRRGNNGGSGAGTPHNNYGNLRDQERGGHEWIHRNFNSRDVHMQPPPPRAMRPFIRPHTPVTAPFIAPPPPIRPFGGPMGYPDMPSPVYYVPAPSPFVAHPPPPAMFFPPIEPRRAMLLKQIDYYFSYENLCKDTYLRTNMDEQGWVSISLIAGFNRVKQITTNIQYILETLRLSNLVEVQGEKIRKRNDWMNWVLSPTPSHFSTSSAPQSPAAPSPDTLAAHLGAVGLEVELNQNSWKGHESAFSRSTSGNFNNQHQVLGSLDGDGDWHDQAKYARSLVRSDTL